MTGPMPARQRAWLLRREIAYLLDDAQSGRLDLLVNAEQILEVAEDLCGVEEQLFYNELLTMEAAL